MKELFFFFDVYGFLTSMVFYVNFVPLPTSSFSDFEPLPPYVSLRLLFFFSENLKFELQRQIH